MKDFQENIIDCPDMKIAFYVFGMTQLQDIMPIYLCFKKNNYDPWICFLDCLERKRQFYYYDEKELKGFLVNVCEKNGLSQPDVGYYGKLDKNAFESDYKKRKPDVVILQGCSHKSINWVPTAKNSKVVNIAFHFDVNERNSLYKIDHNIVSQEKYLDLYREFKFKSHYLGDVKMDHCRFIDNSVTNFSIKNKKNICFIAETHLRVKSNGEVVMSASKTPYEEKVFKNKTSLEFVSKMLKFLKKSGFYVVWKEREKGFPKGPAGGWDNILGYIDEKPDLIIKKDLNFPSSLFYLPQVADISLTLNISTTSQMISNITSNFLNIDTDGDFESQMKKVLQISSNKKITNFKKPDVSKKIFDLILREV